MEVENPSQTQLFEEPVKGEVTKVHYYVRHYQPVKGKKDLYQEYISNEYKTVDEVMDRFEYWKDQPDTIAVEVISVVSTLGLLAGWRREELHEIVTSVNESNDNDDTDTLGVQRPNEID